MNLRRGLAVVGLVALTAAIPATAAAAQSARSVPASSTKICVALVVDARSIGSDVSTACAKVANGATGIDVLTAAGHRLGFRKDGLLCTIDGLPKSGCADVDNTHFWSYYHRAPGSTTWTYSSEGPATYQPVNKSTEGWVYSDGTLLTPENVPYQQICKTVAPSPAASPKATPTHHHSPSPGGTTPTPGAAAASRASTSATAQVSATASAKTPRSPASASPSASGVSPRPSASASSASAADADSPSPGPTTSSGTLAGGVAASKSGGGHGAIDLIVVLLIVAALGGGAVLARSRRSAP